MYLEENIQIGHTATVEFRVFMMIDGMIKDGDMIGMVCSDEPSTQDEHFRKAKVKRVDAQQCSSTQDRVEVIGCTSIFK